MMDKNNAEYMNMASRAAGLARQSAASPENQRIESELRATLKELPPSYRLVALRILCGSGNSTDPANRAAAAKFNQMSR